MTAYYNEIDPVAAAWLRELINAGHIAPGIVDERSIEDVLPSDLRGFTQCHFFAGIGVWSHALRKAGWADDRPVWSGSCPCQPFSAAGKGSGFDDERHLWPHFHWLISQCRPAVVLGEQVASKDGLAWLDLVQADLEGAGYTSGAVDTCAAGFGAPHIRQRLYWVAYADDPRPQGRRGMSERADQCAFGQGGMVGRLADSDSTGSLPGAHARVHRAEKSDGARHGEPERYGAIGGLADVHGTGCSAGSEGSSTVGHGQAIEPDSGACGMADTEGPRPPHRGAGAIQPIAPQTGRNATTRTSPTNGHWRNADWLLCRDGKWRPVESSTFPLVDGAPARVGRLRGYGNAINAQQATAFIEAVMGTNV